MLAVEVGADGWVDPIKKLRESTPWLSHGWVTAESWLSWWSTIVTESW